MRSYYRTIQEISSVQSRQILRTCSSSWATILLVRRISLSSTPCQDTSFFFLPQSHSRSLRTHTHNASTHAKSLPGKLKWIGQVPPRHLWVTGMLERKEKGETFLTFFDAFEKDMWCSAVCQDAKHTIFTHTETWLQLGPQHWFSVQL